jgi:hypothetical protein
MTSSIETFRLRELAERKMAARAVDPAIAAIHEVLAEEYALKVERQRSPTSFVEI